MLHLGNPADGLLNGLKIAGSHRGSFVFEPLEGLDDLSGAKPQGGKCEQQWRQEDQGRNQGELKGRVKSGFLRVVGQCSAHCLLMDGDAANCDPSQKDRQWQDDQDQDLKSQSLL
jgi:hypothetical protein